MRSMLCALALLGLGMAAAPARAQDQHAAQDEHAAMMQMHQRELGLTPAQVERLTAIHTSLATRMHAHCERVRAAGGPNEQTHAAMHGEMKAVMDSAHQQAMAVLTAEQRTKMESLHAAHHGGAGHDMHAAHGSGGDRAAHAGHEGAGHGAGHSAEMAKMCESHAPAATAAPRPRG